MQVVSKTRVMPGRQMLIMSGKVEETLSGRAALYARPEQLFMRGEETCAQLLAC